MSDEDIEKLKVANLRLSMALDEAVTTLRILGYSKWDKSIFPDKYVISWMANSRPHYFIGDALQRIDRIVVTGRHYGSEMRIVDMGDTTEAKIHAPT